MVGSDPVGHNWKDLVGIGYNCLDLVRIMIICGMSVKIIIIYGMVVKIIIIIYGRRYIRKDRIDRRCGKHRNLVV